MSRLFGVAKLRLLIKPLPHPRNHNCFIDISSLTVLNFSTGSYGYCSVKRKPLSRMRGAKPFLLDWNQLNLASATVDSEMYSATTALSRRQSVDILVRNPARLSALRTLIRKFRAIARAGSDRDLDNPYFNSPPLERSQTQYPRWMSLVFRANKLIFLPSTIVAIRPETSIFHHRTTCLADYCDNESRSLFLLQQGASTPSFVRFYQKHTIRADMLTQSFPLDSIRTIVRP